MEDALIDWDEDNIAHVAEHGLTPEEVESVLRNPRAEGDVSRSSGEELVQGCTFTGRWIVVIYEVSNASDPMIIRPITAYEPDDPLG